MSEIKCPYDLNQFILGEPIFENPFPEEECEKRKYYGDCYHCFSTAIAARDHQLKASVTPQLCENAVSRQAVLEVIRKCHCEEWVKADIGAPIEALPPVTPQPKMGRWNFTKHYGRDYYVCSFCGMERMDDHSSGWNYCPFCGAKMREVEG